MLRRPVLALVACAAMVSVSACGLEVKDETEKEKSQVQGLDFQVGQIDVRDAYIAYPAGDGSRPFLNATFVNDGAKADSLAGISIKGGTVAIGGGTSDGSITLPPGVVVQANLPSSSDLQAGSTVKPTDVGGNSYLQITPSGTVLAIGDLVPATFAFSQSGTSKTVQLPVIPGGENENPTSSVPTNEQPAPTESGAQAND